MLIDLEVAAREQLQIESGVEGEQRQQVVEEADPVSTRCVRIPPARA